uniref:Uncharacterized protein n=1 Tax=Anopheles culicifacies TaxID=139723 RepID=A0A182MBP8_9DIPT
MEPGNGGARSLEPSAKLCTTSNGSNQVYDVQLETAAPGCGPSEMNTFVTAVPDFGVDVSIRGSVAVRDAAVRLEERFLELTAHMDFTLVSSYDKLSLLRNQFTYLVQNLTSIGLTFATTLNSATTSNSNVTGTFEPIMLSVSQLQTLQITQISGIIGEIDNIVGAPVRAELQDTFDRFYSSVQNMYGALIQLIAAIQSSNSPGNINSAFVFHVNRAVDLLRANVLPLNYTIGSTGENIRVADAFLRRLSLAMQTGGNTVRSEVRRYKRHVGQLASATHQAAECTRQEVSELSATSLLQTLCNLSSEECPLQAAVQSVVESTTTEFNRVIGAVEQHFEHLSEQSDFVEELTERFSDIYELGLLLADVAIIKRPYSLYCFNKFAHLVEQLITRLTDGVTVCLRQELTRLRSLQSSLVNMLATLVYDVEDVMEHLQLCTMTLYRSECVTELGMLYDHLATQLEGKLDAIENFSHAESNASYKRLQLCVFHSKATVFLMNIPNLRDDIETCRYSGPNLHQPVKMVGEH